jgi:uncharacterized protein YjdB
VQEVTIPLGRTIHLGTAGSDERTATWTSSDPSVATCRVWGGDRICAITGVAEGACLVTAVAPDGRSCIIRVTVGSENIGLERLRLVGRDLES